MWMRIGVGCHEVNLVHIKYLQRLSWFQRLPSELTIRVGRSFASDGDKSWASLMSNLYKIGDTLAIDYHEQLQNRHMQWQPPKKCNLETI